ncbi:MAG TPA: hypothetical protein PLP82_03445 [Deltaproteobacteria bacterium]|jgi:hypothetical protein|nr:hypothetical protein [Deltaproteobacteria bacterium]HRW81505.1 hypothetical protein [Desulfomonilia bacterium]HOA43940.1 hypothetical protein [Deltaproteobacteria bacterium]HOC75433.1 hypothetical protein [Deltaproteobacteria bacterium]HPA74949.1 hypothetical protein [Deltaproteobacteria bacterium]
MTRKQFDHEMQEARSIRQSDPDKADYFAGYIRGLRKAYRGGSFGVDKDHNLWMSLIFDADKKRHARGLGYRDGFQRGMA